jgi:hypothetical protein
MNITTICQLFETQDFKKPMPFYDICERDWQHFSLIVIVQTNIPTAWHLYGQMFDACVYSFINVFETTYPISKIPVNRLCKSTVEHQTKKAKNSVPEYSINLSSKKFYTKIEKYYTGLFTLINNQKLQISVGMFQQSTVLLCGSNLQPLGLHMNTLLYSNCNFCSFVRRKDSMSQSQKIMHKMIITEIM